MHDHGGVEVALVLATPVIAAGALYLGAVLAAGRRGRRWPARRTIAWVLGLLLVLASSVGPLASAAHGDLGAHMVAHTLAGMVAPLLFVLAAPGTLALRTLHAVPARRLSRLLRSGPVRFLTHPVPAAVLNLASLAVLLRTDLLSVMTRDPLLHWLLVLHLAAVGTLFTAAIVPVDPAPHRATFPLRAVVLVLAIAAHTLLATSLAAAPPPGVAAGTAERAGWVMYTLGDVAELLLVAAFCAQWYRAARPRMATAAPHPAG